MLYVLYTCFSELMITISVHILKKYTTLAFSLVFVNLLILAGDVELNPGPESTSSDSDNCMTIFHANIRSLRNKITDIADIVVDFDIVFFTETHLDMLVLDENIHIDGFETPVRSDRDSDGGGIVMYYKSSINIARRADLEVDNVECMWFELKTKLHKILINIVYRSERFSHANFWILLDSMIKHALDETNHVICLGDLNKNFLSPLPANINDIIVINGLYNTIQKPTRFDLRTGNSTLLDPILITDSIQYMDSDTVPLDRNISDHDGTYLTIRCGYHISRSFKRIVWDYKNGDYESMNQRIRDTNWDNIINEADDVHTACSKFTSEFLKIAEDCIPKREITIRCNDKIWFDSQLRREIRKRDRLRKTFLKHKTQVNENKFKNQRNRVNNLKKQAKQKFYSNINESLNELKSINSKMYWKTINCLLKAESPSNELPPLKDPSDNDNLLYEGREKADLLNRYFCSITNLDDNNKVLPEFDDRGINVLSNIVVEEEEIVDIISTLDGNKAVGPDKISNKMLIAVKREVSKPLCLLFNKSLQSKVYPWEWKLAFVIPLFKSGDKSLPSNYRPVSLLSCVSKILEKIVYKHIFNHLYFNMLLYKFQSGFIPGCSTNHQLVEIYHTIITALDSKLLTSITFADVSRAFDRVWIKGLLLKLERYGIKGDLLQWLESYLTGRSQRVVLKESLSCLGELKAGVPQGSVLGPLLFLVFINDIADDMLGLTRLFADDTSIGHTAYDEETLKNMINIDLNNIKLWADQWLVKFNPSKTDIMVFSARNQQNDFIFEFDNIALHTVNIHKHLGVIFSSDCKWSKHIDYLIQRASKQLNVMRKLKFKLKREYLEKIYLTFIRPILEYSSEVWDNCGQINSDRLEKIQLEAARIVTGLTSYASLACIYTETGWEKLSTRREVKKLCLFYKITTGETPEYLYDLIPPTVEEISNYNLRNRQNISQPLSRLTLYQQSFFPATIKLWNSLESNIRQLPAFGSFKQTIQTHFFKNVKPPLYYNVGDRYINILHTRIRNKCSALNSDLYHANLVPNSYCACGFFNENAEHFLLYCVRYHIQRHVLLAELDRENIIVNLNDLLYGNENYTPEQNSIIFLKVQTYIKETGRFSFRN